MNIVRHVAAGVLILIASTGSTLAAPAASISAAPPFCTLSEDGGACEITLSYSATDVPDGWVVEVLAAGFDFLEPISAPGTTISNELDVLVTASGKTFGVVLNQGMASGELLATVNVAIVTESLPGDTDGDGVKNEDDAFPNDPNEFQDLNGNGIGDNADNAAGGGNSGGGGSGSPGSGGTPGGNGATDNGVTGSASVTAGVVELTRAGTSIGSNVSTIAALQAGDIVRTGVAAAIELALQDDAENSATLTLRESSEFVLETVTDPATDTVWSLLNTGEVGVMFNRQTSDQSKGTRRCPVRTPNVGVCARGTQYTVEYLPNGESGTTIVTVSEGTVELVSGSGELVALVDAGESFEFEVLVPEQFLDISGRYSSTAYLMTTSNSANVTELHIINSSDTAQSFIGTLYDRSGQLLGDPAVSLATGVSAMGGRVVITSEDLEFIFGIEPWRGPAMLEIEAIAPFDVMTKLTNPSGLVSNTNCVRDRSALNVEGFDSDVVTYVRFINTSSSVISEIRGSFFDQQGTLVGDSDVLLLQNLQPKQQVWINRDQLAEIVGSQWTGVGALQVGEQPGLKLLNLNFVNGDTFFNFSCFENSDSGFVFLQTTSTSPYTSRTHFINTSAEAQQFRGTLYSVSGSLLGSPDQPLHVGMIAPYGRLELSSADLEGVFGVPAWSGPALLEVSGDGNFDLMTRLTSASGLISNSNCTRERQVHNIEGFDSAVLSFVRLINVGDEPLVSISGELFDTKGDAIGDGSEELVGMLPARSAVWLNRNDLSDIFGDTWVGEASLTVGTTNNALRLLNLNFVNTETFTNFSCYEFGF